MLFLMLLKIVIGKNFEFECSIYIVKNLEKFLF